MRRVSVVGSTGTGKTTLARELAALLTVPHVELDAIIWQPGWTLLPVDAFRGRVVPLLDVPGWVVDGNYGGAGVRDLVWDRADTVVWLDYSLGVILRRLWSRTNARIRGRVEVWPGTGNRETIRNAYLSTQSLYVWALRSYRRRRRVYTQLFADPRYAHVTRLRFTRPAEADRWLAAQRDAAATEAGVPGSSAGP